MQPLSTPASHVGSPLGTLRQGDKETVTVAGKLKPIPRDSCESTATRRRPSPTKRALRTTPSRSLTTPHQASQAVRSGHGRLAKLSCRRSDLPILLAMEELPLADARNRLSELVADVEKTHARVTITKHGHPAAVLVSPEDLASLEETLDLLSDPEALAGIREAEAEYVRGDVTTGEEMAHLIEERRRRQSGAA